MSTHTKVDGQVSISVRQLDDLRTIISQSGDTIKELKDQVKDLEGKQKKVIIEARLDRSSHDYMIRITDALDSMHWNPRGIKDINTQMVSFERFPMLELSKRFKRGEVFENFVHYENLEDILSQLEVKAAKKVEEKMETLTNEYSKARSELLDLRTQHFAEIENLKTAHQESIASFRKQYQKSIDNLLEEIKVLKGEEVKKSQQEYIAELHRKINQLESRTWFQKLFNLK